MDSDFLSVNEHYLDRVIDLSTVKDVEAAEDIYAANGMKLVAKGGRITASMQDRLIIHKLKKPLETCLQVAGGIQSNDLVQLAQRVLDENPEMHPLIGSTTGPQSPLGMLQSTDLNNGLSLMMTMADRASENMLLHYLMVGLVSYGIAYQMRATQSQLQTVLVAGLLHDIGELYINPAYLHTHRVLPPSEWRHVIVHPIIAQKLLQETTSLEPEIGRAILEHHERFNGFGYPRNLHGHSISQAGQVVALAEMISGIFTRGDQPLTRAELAAKVVPGEHAPELVAAISQTFKLNRQFAGTTQEFEPPTASPQLIKDQLMPSLEWLHAVSASGKSRPRDEDEILKMVTHRLKIIQQVYASTGMDLAETDLRMKTTLQDASIQFEMHLIAKEVLWRLRDLARDLALRCNALGPEREKFYLPLIDCLHGTAAPAASTDDVVVAG